MINKAYCFSFVVVVSILISCAGKKFRQQVSVTTRPNIILVMSDDQGWGQVGYYDHPILRTPNIDRMAKGGLRLDRFYAGAPVCSPTRASVLTARANDRSAVFAHGYPMRLQEKTLAEALKQEGYQTAHFGKWHLDGLRGPGVPILKEDQHNPGAFGFEEWISVTNFFDIDPLMSHRGKIAAYIGSSSELIVGQALDYIQSHRTKPFFVVIWFGSPHDPWSALASDKAQLPASLADKDKSYLGEIVEMDRSIGRLNDALDKMDLSENTLVWFNSDNGGLPEGGKDGVGGLRGYKGSVYEGGLRVPCVIKWPAKIKGGQISEYPASTMDIFPTIVSILGLGQDVMLQPFDGRSIEQAFHGAVVAREKKIPFKYGNKGALIDNHYKLVVEHIEKGEYHLFNLTDDPLEAKDILAILPEKGQEMIEYYTTWLQSVANSVAGNDYQGGLASPDPEPQFWWDTPAYQPYLELWKNRPEYHDRLKKANKIKD